MPFGINIRSTVVICTGELNGSLFCFLFVIAVVAFTPEIFQGLYFGDTSGENRPRCWLHFSPENFSKDLYLGPGE